MISPVAEVRLQTLDDLGHTISAPVIDVIGERGGPGQCEQCLPPGVDIVADAVGEVAGVGEMLRGFFRREAVGCAGKGDHVVGFFFGIDVRDVQGSTHQVRHGHGHVLGVGGGGSRAHQVHECARRDVAFVPPTPVQESLLCLLRESERSDPSAQTCDPVDEHAGCLVIGVVLQSHVG